MHDDDPIPLDDSEPSASIIHQPSRDSVTSVRSQRKSARREFKNARICFIPEYASGKTDPAECPVINISATGLSIEFDRRVPIALRGTITYRSECGLPVHVGCVVRHCVEQMDGFFRLGIQLDRKLRPEESRPLRIAIGREIAPGIRARKLKRQLGTYEQPG